MALDDAFDASRLAGHIDRTPPLPVAGFWMRLIAFGLDWIILRLALYGLALGAREPLLELGAWPGRLAVLIMFLYFWLADGPVGKGRTLGKALLGLRTVSAENGAPLGALPAAWRALLLIPLMLITQYFILPWALPKDPVPWAGFVAFMLTMGGTAAFYLAQAIATGFNPARQGFHDRAANSLVLAQEHDETTWAVIEQQAGPSGMLRIRRSVRSGWVAFASALILLGFMKGKEAWNSPAPAPALQSLYDSLRTNDLLIDLPLSSKRLDETDGSGAESGAGASTKPAAQASSATLSAVEKPSAARKPSASAAANTSSSTASSSPQAQAKSQGPNTPIQVEISFLRMGRERKSPAEVRALLKEMSGQFIHYLAEEQKKSGAEARIPSGSKFVFLYQEFLDLAIYKPRFEVTREERFWP